MFFRRFLYMNYHPIGKQTIIYFALTGGFLW